MDPSAYIPPNKSLVLDGVTKRYGSVPAVDQVSFMAEDREFLAIVGPTGCGKTTLLRLIAGLEKLDAGHIFIHGRCVDKEKPSDRRVRMVFQDNALWPHMKVFDKEVFSNLSFSMKIRRQPPQKIEEKANAIAGRLGIEKKLYPRKPDQLSAGQQQMVGIGRAMTIEPTILLLDEPLSNVDPQHRLALRKELKDYHIQIGATTLHVTHNLVEAFSLADRLAIMQEGKIIQIDAPSKIRRSPANQFVSDFLRCFNM
ncbi:MAG: ATP-binding cassette domain-containing protein [Proteobacteria bacterium]|nr:ATP-binding cassette domain-containing protein [Pseudomonadota bacterium]NIS72319.1 ATP-binding cassette domain-containing protein [Pseudomonadota bacterium]